jgi:branched-chain amino acid transport system ATP-binding protein
MGSKLLKAIVIDNTDTSLPKAYNTVLLVEQNVHMALGISDRAYVLEVGKITLSGKAKDLIQVDQVRKAYLGM